MKLSRSFFFVVLISMSGVRQIASMEEDAGEGGGRGALTAGFSTCDTPTADRTQAPAIALATELDALLTEGRWSELQLKIRGCLSAEAPAGWLTFARSGTTPAAADAAVVRAWLQTNCLSSRCPVVLYEYVRQVCSGKTTVSDEDLERALLAILMFKLEVSVHDACCRLVTYDGTVLTGRYGEHPDVPWKVAKDRFAEWLAGVKPMIPGRLNFSGPETGILSLFKEKLAEENAHHYRYAYWLAAYDKSWWTSGVIFPNIPSVKMIVFSVDPNPARAAAVCHIQQAALLEALASCPSWHEFLKNPAY